MSAPRERMNMGQAEKMLRRYTHAADEYPVLARQTHRIVKNGTTVNEPININENIMHYVQDTALLISRIDGSLAAAEGGNPAPFDHVVYLDKSARPVSWLVNLFWKVFACTGKDGRQTGRPGHSYINIDRSPWFRNVGIEVTDDGRQKEGGELATYADFLSNLRYLDKIHLARIRALYIPGGIREENAEEIMNTPTALTGRRVLIVDEVSRTGSTIKIAVKLFQLAFPDAAEIQGTYFWNALEPPVRVGSESALTSLPVWYDPNTLTGRGIGGVDTPYYRNRYEAYLKKKEQIPRLDLPKLRTQAFSGTVFSAPLLKDDGTPMGLEAEKVTRALTRDLLKLRKDYGEGTIFFTPPFDWPEDRFEAEVKKQGLLLIEPGMKPDQEKAVRSSPLFYPTFVQKLRTFEKEPG